MSTLFYLPHTDGDQTIPLWATDGGGATVYMRIVNNQIEFVGGQSSSSNSVKFIGTDTLTEGKWYGLYFTYDGGTLTNYSQWDQMTIKLVDPVTGVVTTAAGSDSNNNQPDKWFNGLANTTYYIGNYPIHSNDNDDQLIIANNIMTTLLNGEVQSDAEIAMMLLKPKQWVTDYKIGETARLSESTSTFTFALEDTNSYNATQVYILGDHDQSHFWLQFRYDVV